MNLTEEMLDAAVEKAVEAGLLPRNACREDFAANRDLIRFVLQAAIDRVQRTRRRRFSTAHREMGRGC